MRDIRELLSTYRYIDDEKYQDRYDPRRGISEGFHWDKGRGAARYTILDALTDLPVRDPAHAFEVVEALHKDPDRSIRESVFLVWANLHPRRDQIGRPFLDYHHVLLRQLVDLDYHQTEPLGFSVADGPYSDRDWRSVIRATIYLVEGLSSVTGFSDDT